MVKYDVVSQKIARASAWLSDAENRLCVERSEFLSNADGRDLAVFHLFLAIQECIDLALHWISDDGMASQKQQGSNFF